MKMKKQTREYIVLGVLGLLLIIAMISVIKSNQPKPAQARKPEGTAQAAAKPKAAEKQPAVNSTDWVEKQQNRIATLVGEVKGGRNPFKDLMMPVETANAAPPPPKQAEPATDQGGGILPAWPSASLPALDFIMVEKPVKLKYISEQAAARAVKDATGAVTVTAVKKTRVVRLRGPEEAMPEALEAIARVDVAPDFQLRGVITTSSANFAVISVQGKTYSLYEGDTIPELGWTVKRITPADVTLQKEQFDPVVKRLAGGIA